MTTLARRILLGGVATAAALPAAARYGDAHIAPPAVHPDRELLDVCARLRERQMEWQRHWAAVSEDSDGDTPEDKALDDYSLFVWPGTGAEIEGEDLPAQLLLHRATTPEGRAAKAAAIVTMEDAYKYLDIEICGRDDDMDLMWSALRDCAGEARIPLGKDAA